MEGNKRCDDQETWNQEEQYSTYVSGNGRGRKENTVEDGDHGRVRALRTTRRAGWDPGPMWRGCLRGEPTVGSL